MLKKISTLVVVILAVGITAIALNIFSVEEYVPGEYVIGDKFNPKLEPEIEINENTDGGKMILAAIENFYSTGYASIYQNGTVDTTALGASILSAVTARRIRQDGCYWVDAYTTPKGSGALAAFAPLSMEETLVYDSGQVYYRKAEGSSVVKVKDGKFTASKFQDQREFPSLDSYFEFRVNDPRKPFMYDVTATSILSSTQPTPDESGKFYSFDIELDPIKSTKLYATAVAQTSGELVKSVTFNKLSLKVQIWINGFFKKITAEEHYTAKSIAGDSVVSQISDFFYCFDETEPTMQIEDMTAYFGK